MTIYSVCVYGLDMHETSRQGVFHVLKPCGQPSDREVTVLIILWALSRMWLHKVQINGFFLWSSWPYAHSVISCQGPDFLCRGPALSYTTGCQFSSHQTACIPSCLAVIAPEPIDPMLMLRPSTFEKIWRTAV